MDQTSDGSTDIEVRQDDQKRGNNNNQEEEEEEENASAYKSNDFDDHSTLPSAGEDEYSEENADDDDDSQYSQSPTTGGGSATQRAEEASAGEASKPPATETSASGTTNEAAEAVEGLAKQLSVSTYADDFADEDSTTEARPSISLVSENQQKESLQLNEENIHNDGTPHHTQPANAGHMSARYTSSDGIIVTAGDDIGTVIPSAIHAQSITGDIDGNVHPTTNENQKFAGSRPNDAAAYGGGGSDGKTRSNDRVELDMLKSQIEAARAMLMSTLDEGDNKPDRSLLELVLLAEARGFKEAKNSISSNPSDNASKRRSSVAAANTKRTSGTAPETAVAAAKACVEVEAIARVRLERRVESLERDLARAGQESRAQSGRAASLQRRLDAGGGGGGGGGHGEGRGQREGTETGDILALKSKATQLVERLRQEKTARLKAERETQGIAGKVQVLSDHIEKLMLFLKHEATQKSKAHDQQRRLQKELELVKARSTALLHSNQAKDRVMTELREGSKILEDQLRLMDEKYMELRTKLDWTRQKADKDVRRARAQASALRTKWALLCGDGKGGENSLLDAMPVNVTHLNHSASAPGLPLGRTNGGAVPNNEHQHQPQRQDQSGRSRGGARGRSPPSPIIVKGGVEAWAPGGRVGGVAIGRGGATGNPGGGGMTPNHSEQGLFMKQGRRRVTASVGGGGGPGVRGSSPHGGMTNFAPGLSAGSDPGRGRVGGLSSRGDRGGGQRPPWSEQGNNGGGNHSQLLYA